MPETSLVDWVQQAVMSLKGDPVQRVKVYGRQAGGDLIAWSWSESFEAPKRSQTSIDSTISQHSTSKFNPAPWQCVKTLTEDSGLVYSVSTSPSGKILISGAGKHTVKVWNLRTDKIVHTLKSSAECVYCVAVSPDGQTFASSGSETNINIKNLKTGFPIRDIGGLFSGHSRYIYSLTFSPNNQLIASGSADNTIKIWDLKTGQVIHTLTGHTGRASAS